MEISHHRTSTGNWPERIQIENTSFEFVQSQRGDNSAVYRSNESFLRIGRQEKIESDLAIHKKMHAAGFPVANLISDGTWEGERYYIESSLGTKFFGQLFKGSFQEKGEISQDLFEQFVHITEKFAQAQLATSNAYKDWEVFSRAVHVDSMCKELPDYADKIRQRFELVKDRMQSVPFVLCHGDYNPFNLFPRGVIDLETSFNGPFGYDLVSNIYSIEHFPLSSSYEFYAQYQFSEEQKKMYYDRMNAVSMKGSVAPISSFKKELEFCRALWLAANLGKTRKLQEFRYNLLIREFLS